MLPAEKPDRPTSKRPAGELEQIGQQLRNYYRACTTEELPPRLLALVKKLDEKMKNPTSQIAGERQDSRD